jgi:hypothetical protein
LLITKPNNAYLLIILYRPKRHQTDRSLTYGAMISVENLSDNDEGNSDGSDSSQDSFRMHNDMALHKFNKGAYSLAWFDHESICYLMRLF